MEKKERKLTKEFVINLYFDSIGWREGEWTPPEETNDYKVTNSII